VAGPAAEILALSGAATAALALTAASLPWTIAAPRAVAFAERSTRS
jgi:AsmA protein